MHSDDGGSLALTVMLNVFNSRIVGWHMREALHTGMVLDAMDMVATQRRATNVVHPISHVCIRSAL